MGQNVMNLLRNSYLINDFVKIDFKRKDSFTLLEKLRVDYKVHHIIHAAGVRYKKNWDNWLNSNDRKESNKDLLNGNYSKLCKINKV